MYRSASYKLPRRTPLIFPLLILLPLLWSCGKSPMHRTLLQAEAVMEENPDSAYALLAPLHPDSTSDEEDRALHALLLTQAMHKTDMIFPDSIRNNAVGDSLINIALRYYDNGKNSETDTLLMKALFYRGEIDALSPKDFVKALAPLSRSLDIALRVKDDYWTARNYSSMARVYYAGGAFEDEVKAQEKAVEYFKRTGRDNFIKHAISEYAIGLHNASYYDEALKVEEELLSLVTKDDNPELWEEASFMKARTLFVKQEPEKCLEVIEQLEKEGMIYGDLELFRILCHIYLGNLPQAREYYGLYGKDLDEESKTMIANAFAKSSGDNEAQLSTLREIFEGLSDEYTQFTGMGFNTVQMMVHRDSSDRFEVQKKELSASYYLYLGLIVVVSLVVLGYVARRSYKVSRKRKEAERKLGVTEAEKEVLARNLDELKLLSEAEQRKNIDLSLELESLSEMLEVREREYETRIASIMEESEERARLLKSVKASMSRAKKGFKEKVRWMRERINNQNIYMLRGEYGWMNDVVAICNLHKKRDAAQRDNTILDSLKRRLRKFDIENEDKAELEASINKLTGNLMKDLRKKIVVDSELYYHVALLLIVGFNMDSIAYFIHKDSVRSVYNIVGRLRKKIMELPENERGQFSVFLSEKNSGQEKDKETPSE